VGVFTHNTRSCKSHKSHVHRCRRTRSGNIIQESGANENGGGGKAVILVPGVFFSLKQRVVTEPIERRKSRCLCRVRSSTPYKSRIFFLPIYNGTAAFAYNAHNNNMMYIHYSGAECKLIYIRLSESIVTICITILTYCAFDGKQCSDVKLCIYIYIYMYSVRGIPTYLYVRHNLSKKVILYSCYKYPRSSIHT